MTRELPNPHSAFSLLPSPHDALLLVSFGGPEGPDEVGPFLERVAQGRKIPAERLEEVAHHYELFGGLSPLNAENRALLAALIAELNAHGPRLAVYWGNRHGHPLLSDTVQQMAEDGVRRALAFVTSVFGSYPSCRQYREDIEQARQDVGPLAPTIDKLRLSYNHPGFIEAAADRVEAAVAKLPLERREAARLVFTAHGIPTAMA
ncbi:MAG: ferrochelatase, partial [Thermoguttaceae bacterium]